MRLFPLGTYRSSSRFAMCARFTDEYKQVMNSAKQEAQRLRHEYIGTEHLLLGLIKEDSGAAAAVLRGLNVDCSNVRLRVDEIAISGTVAGTGILPQTPRARNVIEYSKEEARDLNHRCVGAEHLLLGLLREKEGCGGVVLMNFGLTLEDTREEVVLLLDS